MVAGRLCNACRKQIWRVRNGETENYRGDWGKWTVSGEFQVPFTQFPPMRDGANAKTVHDAIKGQPVSSLMITDQKEWDVELLNDIFEDRDVNLILSIPIGRVEFDSWYWNKEKLGTYTVKSAYAVLQGLECVMSSKKQLCTFWYHAHLQVYAGLLQYKREEVERIVMIMWSLWKNRNNIVWNQKSMEASEVISSANICLNQWKNAQDKSFDNFLGFMTQADGKERWEPPQLGEVKINTDVDAAL
ncbi:uncharacterized protein LOC141703396 [Apium graveolens]|uniref:uncharacterized protein LOC141703396 n=1 Tax=Apium graveolens TaxID=4045 RepID=UPI003D7A82A0